MKTVEIYTTPTCPYCSAAKQLLAKKGIKYAEIDVSRDFALRDLMTRRALGVSGADQSERSGQVFCRIVGNGQLHQPGAHQATSGSRPPA